jgi:hypothetical protein
MDQRKKIAKLFRLEISEVCSSTMLFLVVVWLEAKACSRSMAGIAGSNLSEDMDVTLFVCCAGRGLCDELVTRSEQSYRVCVCVCVLLRVI